MWVVKVGGSLGRDPLLRNWLAMIGAHGSGRVVLVPGGGAFADAVRAAHAHWGFDERAAHRMALLAMAQYAYLLQALEPRLFVAADESSLRAALGRGRVAVWAPLDLLVPDADELASWDVTADSLAAHLATRLGAGTLVLVKSCPIGSGLTTEDHVAAGVLDAGFARAVAGARFQLRIVAKTDIAAVRAALEREAACDGES